MMCLSQTSGYAVRALSCLESDPARPRLIRELAVQTGIPKPYLAKIMHQLTACGLVVARRGYQGGVSLARPAAKVTLLEVVRAVEGEHWIAPCILGLEGCDANHLCVTHQMWSRVRAQVERKLSRTTLAQVVRAAAPRRPARCAPVPRPAAQPRPKTGA